jgi:hypothetical protein
MIRTPRDRPPARRTAGRTCRRRPGPDRRRRSARWVEREPLRALPVGGASSRIPLHTRPRAPEKPDLGTPWALVGGGSGFGESTRLVAGWLAVRKTGFQRGADLKLRPAQAFGFVCGHPRRSRRRPRAAGRGAPPSRPPVRGGPYGPPRGLRSQASRLAARRAARARRRPRARRPSAGNTAPAGRVPERSSEQRWLEHEIGLAEKQVWPT